MVKTFWLVILEQLDLKPLKKRFSFLIFFNWQSWLKKNYMSNNFLFFLSFISFSFFWVILIIIILSPSKKNSVPKIVIHSCCWNGNEEALSRHINNNDKDFINFEIFGQSPFHTACQNNQLGVIRLMLENKNDKIDINKKNNQGQTPFYKACLDQNTILVRLLSQYEKGICFFLRFLVIFSFAYSLALLFSLWLLFL